MNAAALRGLTSSTRNAPCSSAILNARLIVAADGRDSKLARLARVPGRIKPHGRFFYWAYWSGVRPATTRSKVWLLDPDAAYTFPNEDDLRRVCS